MTTPALDARWVSTQFGPDPGDVGGISSVLASYAHLGPHGHRVRVVPSYSSTAPLWGVAPYLRALGTLLVTPRSRLGVVHAHVSRRGSFVREGSLAVIAHWRGCPTCVTVHGSCFGVNFSRFRPLYLFVLRRADRIVTLSTGTGDLLRPYLPAERMTTVHNPVDIPDDPSPVEGTAPVAVFAGELSRRKGFDVLSTAWELVRSRVPDAVLLVAGPSSDVPLPDQPAWTHLGVVDREKVPVLVDQARLAVLPSRNEAMPVFLLEAMAGGRPVVATDVAAIPSMVGDAGIIVRAGDAEVLAGALTRLLQDPVESARLGAIGRARAVASHSLAAVATQLGRLYDDAVHAHELGRRA
jgi:glycosyltransferase involved in cell wall biosynthesis